MCIADTLKSVKVIILNMFLEQYTCKFTEEIVKKKIIKKYLTNTEADSDPEKEK